MGESLYIRISGVGRSGSTVIGAYIAGRIEGAIHVGEVIRFSRIKTLNSILTRRCSCGRQLPDCSFWSRFTQVIESAQPCLYSEVVSCLKEEDDRTSVIIDSSKTYDQNVSADLDLHLVKDPRATTWSWFRKREFKTADDVERLKTMTLRELPRHILYEYKWFITYRLKKLPLLRYEEFVRVPERYISQIAEEFGLEVTDAYQPSSNHGVGGNVARHSFDGELVLDDAWRYEAPLWFRSFLTIVYIPILAYLAFKSDDVAQASSLPLRR